MSNTNTHTMTNYNANGELLVNQETAGDWMIPQAARNALRPLITEAVEGYGLPAADGTEMSFSNLTELHFPVRSMSGKDGRAQMATVALAYGLNPFEFGCVLRRVPSHVDDNYGLPEWVLEQARNKQPKKAVKVPPPAPAPSDEDEVQLPAPQPTPVPKAKAPKAKAPKAKVTSNSIPAALQVAHTCNVKLATAASVFKLQFKKLKDTTVNVVNSTHPAVPEPISGLYLGYNNGVTLSRILAVMERVHRKPRHQRYLSNIWIHGLHGTGKSALMWQVAAMLRRPFFEVSFTVNTTLTELLGDYDIRAVGNGGADVWIYGLLVQALTTPYAIVVLDEFSRAAGAMSTALNGVLMRRQVTLPTGEVIPFAEGVNVVVTDNNKPIPDSSGMYDGAEMDASAADRFATCINVPHLPPAKDAEILHKDTGLRIEACVAIAETISAMREAAAQGDPRMSVSLRPMSSWADALVEGCDTLEAFKETVCTVLSQASVEQAELLLREKMPSEIINDPTGAGAANAGGNQGVAVTGGTMPSSNKGNPFTSNI